MDFLKIDPEAFYAIPGAFMEKTLSFPMLLEDCVFLRPFRSILR